MYTSNKLSYAQRIAGNFKEVPNRKLVLEETFGKSGSFHSRTWLTNRPELEARACNLIRYW